MNPTTHVILQAGSVGSAVNQVFGAVVEPFFDALLMIGGISFLVGIAMAIYYIVIEHQILPTSWGRAGALSEAVGHIKKVIFGALGLWLAIYIIFLIGNLAGATTANPAQVAWQVFTAEFKLLYQYLTTALQHATSTTP